MKKLLIFILAIALLPVTGFADTFVESSSATTSFEANITPVSTFSVASPATGSINKAGTHSIGGILITNNTRDGYAVTITPTNGLLTPSETNNGETAIPYDLRFTHNSGDLGKGMEIRTLQKGGTAGLEKGAALPVVALTGTTQHSPTNQLDIAATMVISATYANNLEMAGTYTESFVFEYSDI